jgi:hypothetical protein
MTINPGFTIFEMASWGPSCRCIPTNIKGRGDCSFFTPTAIGLRNLPISAINGGGVNYPAPRWPWGNPSCWWFWHCNPNFIPLAYPSISFESAHYIHEYTFTNRGKTVSKLNSNSRRNQEPKSTSPFIGIDIPLFLLIHQQFLAQFSSFIFQANECSINGFPNCRRNGGESITRRLLIKDFESSKLPPFIDLSPLSWTHPRFHPTEQPQRKGKNSFVTQ